MRALFRPSSEKLDAPTPAEIVASEAGFAIACKRCRSLTEPPGLAHRLVAAGRGDTPVNHMIFRCQACGDLGVPWITGQGNLTLGRPRLWPPGP